MANLTFGLVATAIEEPSTRDAHLSRPTPIALVSLAARIGRSLPVPQNETHANRPGAG
jgi:hypothetical protein